VHVVPVSMIAVLREYYAAILLIMRGGIMGCVFQMGSG
jgi:hypothetical protein